MLFTKFTQAHASFGRGIAISSIGYFLSVQDENKHPWVEDEWTFFKGLLPYLFGY